MLLTTILSLSLITGLISAPPSTNLVVTVQTDITLGDAWLELFVEGVNITTPGFAPLIHPVHTINYVKVNDYILVPDVEWNVTECRLYIIYNAVNGDAVSVYYSGGYALRETVEISGTVKLNSIPVDKGFVGVQVEGTGANITLRTMPSGTGQMPLSDVEVVSFYLTDTLDNPKSKFQRGEQVRFWMTIKNNAMIGKDVLMAFNLYDSENAIHGFDHTTATLLPGGYSNWTSEVTIAKWAAIGNTQAYAAVFSDWPQNNGYPYAPEKPVNLTIIESEYMTSPTNQIPQQPVENGTYSMLFTLPPDPSNGTYKVNVVAKYDGMYSEVRSTQFRVLDIPAPPRASFIVKPPMSSPNSTISFDGSFSSPEGFNDSITGYWWDFGNGKNSTEQKPSTSYTQNGNYTVTLNVTDSEGYWNTTSRTVRITEIHDVALESVQCIDKIYTDWLFSIKATVRNKGTFAETFNIIGYYNGSMLGTTAVSNLAPQTERVVDIQWNTTGLPIYVSYIIAVEADLPTDINITDNMITDGTTRTKALGDVDGDRDVDIFDIVFIASIYGVDSKNPRWNIQADLQPNGKVDIFDVVVAASSYGKEY
jgi:PKD repeat protein